MTQATRRGTGGEQWKALLPHRYEDMTHRNQLTRVGENLEEREDSQVSYAIRQRATPWNESVNLSRY